MMNIKLRRLNSSDYEKYLELRLEGFKNQPMQFRFSPEDEVSLGKELISRKLESDYVIGAFYDNHLVGIGGLGVLFGSKLKHRALIWGMYVTKEFRSKGISKLIVDSLVSQANLLHIESLLLTVVSENNVAMNLYEKSGFIQYAIDKNAVKNADGTSLDEVLMVKNLV
ncbi:GNAT family N-acetyltransferase [Serratia proteamaculans]|uniref:GNAT family N-acetyltransferase n=1 Tax=Serratia proteamaculans TaxID=28151 RepID=UPI0039AFA146